MLNAALAWVLVRASVQTFIYVGRFEVNYVPCRFSPETYTCRQNVFNFYGKICCWGRLGAWECPAMFVIRVVNLKNVVAIDRHQIFYLYYCREDLGFKNSDKEVLRLFHISRHPKWSGLWSNGKFEFIGQINYCLS